MSVSHRTFFAILNNELQSTQIFGSGLGNVSEQLLDTSVNQVLLIRKT